MKRWNLRINFDVYVSKLL